MSVDLVTVPPAEPRRCAREHQWSFLETFLCIKVRVRVRARARGVVESQIGENASGVFWKHS